MYPGNGQTHMFTEWYTIQREDEGARGRGGSSPASSAAISTATGTVQRQWCLIAGLDNAYPEMYDNPEIIQSYDRWVTSSSLREQ